MLTLIYLNSLGSDLLIAGVEDSLTVPNRIAKVCDPCAETGGAITVFKDSFCMR